MLEGCLKLASFSIAALPHLAGALLLVAHAAPAPPKARPVEKQLITAGLVVREDPPRPPLPARTLTMKLDGGEAVPEGKPNTWVHIPRGFTGKGGVDLTFIFHGFKNCID